MSISGDIRKDMTQITVCCKISKHLNEALKMAIKNGKFPYKTLAEYYEYAIEEAIATELNIGRY